jgi:hypothetical protein
MHQVVTDLFPLFDSPDGARVILGGDLNVTTCSKDAAYLARAEALLASVRALGLVEAKTLVAEPPASAADCPCGAQDRCAHLGMEVPAELSQFKFARQKSKLAGTIRGSFFVIKGEY